MEKIPVIAVFDIGKTNKKILLFDEQYKVVYQQNRSFEETVDEDGFPCEAIIPLTAWIKTTLDTLQNQISYQIKAINFSAYGASFVYLDAAGELVPPLYNYLKPFPLSLQKAFYSKFGGNIKFAKQTASPVLGSLNSGLQLYRIKLEQPDKFEKINCALHLPQYASYAISGAVCSDISSVGCHTGLWDFEKNQYHSWVETEGLLPKFAPLKDTTAISGYTPNGTMVGTGLHDSSAALIPYLYSFKEPFVLLSTGTWCISLNPFNNNLLTTEELEQDCLCYLTFNGNPVKASRLFAGKEHEEQIIHLAAFFSKGKDYYKTVLPDNQLLQNLKPELHKPENKTHAVMTGQSAFSKRELTSFANYETAYHQLMTDIMVQQVHSTNLVLKGTHVQRIFVDGGFSENPIYMYLLAAAFPETEIYAAAMAQASALGAAMVIHRHWNSKAFPADIIDLKLYTDVQENSI